MSSYSDTMASYKFDNVQHGADIENEEHSHVIEFFQHVYKRFEISEKWEAIQQFVEDHPFASVFLIVTMAMCTVPIVVFILFVMTSLALSIMGVFFIEGTLVAIGTFILGGVLFFVAMLGVGFSIFLICSYYSFQIAKDVFYKLLKKMPYIPFVSEESTEFSEEKEE